MNSAPFNTLLIGLLLVTSNVLPAQDQGSKNNVSALSDEVLYRIGGGQAVSMGAAATMHNLGIGAGWNTPLMCGNLDLSTTVQNQLNGTTKGFQSIMGSVIRNASRSVASLPAMIIQRADPGLYNVLTNGILQARLDFDRSKKSCLNMANRMANIAQGQLGWGQLAQGMSLSKSVTSKDAVAAVDKSEQERGNRGVPWVGGQYAGGTGQAPITLISDVSRAGYNLLNGRNVDDRSPISSVACGNRMSCQIWPSPQAAIDFATRVLGDQEERTCDSCIKTQSTPGVGLSPLIQVEYELKLQVLRTLVGSSSRPDQGPLGEASSQMLPITRGVIEALRDDPDRELLTQRLASEAALAGVLEKALMLQRILLTGSKEPNVAINQLALSAIRHESDALAQEIDNLKTELELRKTLADNTTMMLIERRNARSNDSRAIYEGDPVRNRLDDIQRSPSGGGPP